MTHTQEQLNHIYDNKLRPLERKILNFCALLNEPLTKPMLLKILRNFKTVFSASKIRFASDLDPYCNKLKKLKLINYELMCPDSIQEDLALKASQDRDFQTIISKIANYWPMQENVAGLGISFSVNYIRLIRDIRFALLSHNQDLLAQRTYLFYNKCSSNNYLRERLVRTCYYYFQNQILHKMPVSMQLKIFCILLDYRNYKVNMDNLSVLESALQLEITKDIPASEYSNFNCVLIKRLLMSANLEKAEAYLEKLDDLVQAQKLRAWLLFMQGKTGESIQLFETALKALRKENRSKNLYFNDECGLIYILALLKDQNKTYVDSIRKLMNQIQAKPNSNSVFSDAYNAISALLYFLEMNLDMARFKLKFINLKLTGFEKFIVLLVNFWVEKTLAKEMLEILPAFMQGLKNCGLDWLFFEAGSLLQRANAKYLSQPYQTKLETISSQIKITPLVDIIKPEQDWLRSLHALQHLTHKPENKTDTGQYRLAWLVQPQSGHNFYLQPKLQKQNARGQWTKGRNIALSKLFNQPETMEYLTNEDHRVLSALKIYNQYWGGKEYGFDTQKVIPLLIGHPRLFLLSNPDVAVEFVSGEPELSVYKKNNKYQLSFAPQPAAEDSVAVVQETQTRYKIVQFSAEHRQIARILGEKSLAVPKSGYKELVQTISQLSNMLTIHSDIKEHTQDVQEVEADCTPCLQITPAGSGFNMQMAVRPFGTAGPFLNPGTGQSSIIAEVKGKRLQARRNLKQEAEKAGQLEEACPCLALYEQDDQIWMLSEPEHCLQVLSEVKELQDQGKVNVFWPEGEKLSVVKNLTMDQLKLSLGSKQDWFELKGHIDLDQESMLKLKDLLQKAQASKSNFVQLDDKRYAALSNRLRQRLKELAQVSETKGEKLKMPAYSALMLEDLSHEAGSLKGDKSWTERKKDIEEAFDYKPDPPSTLKAKLRDYQLQGYQWLARMARLGFGACLADDMGLGKTLQALALILERAPKGPSLVIAPTSVCSNWLNEADRFAPTLHTIAYSGKLRNNLIEDLKPFDLVVCSYALLNQDAESLARVSWQNIVLDEAQAIKNWTAKRTQAAINLEAGFKMVTTGTPIENNLSELWTLFRFLNPGLLGTRKQFQERFALAVQKYQDQEQSKILKKIIHPFILRRLKAQVMEELPPRTEITLKVSMSREEAAFYEAMRQNALENVENEDQSPGQKHFRILAELTKLRQACCHPRMIEHQSTLQSSKLDLLQDIISELMANGHKALVFSQFVKHLALVCERLNNLNINYRYLDGSTPAQAREKEIKAFQSGLGDLFLISLKAGGQGLNLTAADYVIHLDPWWNPAVEDQATDRTHRIGQKNPVTVYRLVTENTVEEKIVQLHTEKRELADRLLEGSDISAKVSADELMRLLQNDAQLN